MTLHPSPGGRFVGTINDAFQVALACYRAGDKIRTARLCRQIIQANPRLGNAWHLWGIVALDERQHEAALDRIGQAIAIHPSEAVYRNTLGEALRALGRWNEAIAAYRRALELNPTYAEAWSNQGVCFREAGVLEEARVCYERALQLDPQLADAHYNRALLWLLQGDYVRGWLEYEWRWRRAELPPREFSQPRWDGQPLPGGTILIYSEQGLGDTLQFVRYAPLVRARCRRLVVECEPPLEKVLAGCRGIDVLIAKGQPLPQFDMQAPLLSLPALFSTTLESVPADVPYLAPDEEFVARWRSELADTRSVKVGIIWHGSPLYRRNAFRSPPLSAFAPLAAVPGVQLYSLQKGAGAEQLAGAAFPVIDLGSRIDQDAGPFMDTAAIMRALDLVVTSDTAPAHLAGALGVRTWLALPTLCDWRWLLEREDSPWYPTMRLFRQPVPGDWESVFRRMAESLQALVGLTST